MTNAIALFDGQSSVVLSEKTGKTGSFARAIAFASRQTRESIGQAMYAKWLQNGQYRPIVDDILSCGLVPKSAVAWVSALVPTNGAVKKEQLFNLCNQVHYVISNKRTKDGEPVTPKGQKAFVYGVVCAIASEARASNTVIEG